MIKSMKNGFAKILQKKKTLIILGIISLLLIVIFLSQKINKENDKYSFIKNGVKYAIVVDGSKVNAIPAAGLYDVNVSCTNTEAKWLYDEWALYIGEITGDVSCDLTFTTVAKTYLNSYIIGLSGTTQGTGKVVNENGYRYEGKNPNNYVWFNNELWRIIGVFDSTTHGVANTNLVKIIRAETLDGLAWHKSNTNDWTKASLNKLLNDNYYNRTDGTSSGNCDYSQKGIMSKYREMIQSVTWHLGGPSTNAATAKTLYTAERGTTVYSGRPTSTTGYIGLMYPSDYGYSVLSSSCARKTKLGDYGSAICGGKSWLYGKGQEWTLAPNSGSDGVFYVSDFGYVSIDFASSGYGIRPVLYLKSSTYKISGEGTASSPYILGV